MLQKTLENLQELVDFDISPRGSKRKFQDVSEKIHGFMLYLINTIFVGAWLHARVDQIEVPAQDWVWAPSH